MLSSTETCPSLTRAYMLLLFSVLLPPTDPVQNWLVDAAEIRQTQSRAPGTRANHEGAVKRLAEFCLRFGINPARMSHFDVCIWIEYLAALGAAPGTIRNQLSHARVHARLAGGTLDGLQHQRVGLAVDAISRNKDRPSAAKDAIPVELFRNILAKLPKDSMRPILRAAFITIYMGAMRQSEVAPPSARKFDPTRHLTRGDVTITDRVTITEVGQKTYRGTTSPGS